MFNKKRRWDKIYNRTSSLNKRTKYKTAKQIFILSFTYSPDSQKNVVGAISKATVDTKNNTRNQTVKKISACISFLILVFVKFFFYINS